jgi:hypothetical protein
MVLRNPADGSVTLALGPGAPVVRRAVGPVAWAVLECVAASAIRDGDPTVSHESVRGIADSLGLAKDTVARSLRRLADAHLVDHVAARERDGRFGESHYRLSLPSDLFVGVVTPIATQQPPKRDLSSRSPRPAQLSLIDAISNER